MKEGGQLAWEAIQRMFRRRYTLCHVSKSIQRDIWAWFIVALGISFGVHVGCVLPIRLMMQFTSSTSSIHTAYTHLTEFTQSLPLLLLLGWNRVHWKPMDRLFMHACHALISTPNVLERIQSMTPKVHWVAEAKSYGWRIWKRSQMMLLYFMLSLIPFFGAYAGACMAFYLSYRTWGIWVATALACLTALPPALPWATFVVDFLQDARIYSHEFLQPYFLRCGMKPKERHAWWKRYGHLAFGYAAVWTLLSQLFRGIWGASAMVYLVGQLGVATLVEYTETVYNPVDQAKPTSSK